jgi:hypothetical protein
MQVVHASKTSIFSSGENIITFSYRILIFYKKQTNMTTTTTTTKQQKTQKQKQKQKQTTATM